MEVEHQAMKEENQRLKGENESLEMVRKLREKDVEEEKKTFQTSVRFNPILSFYLFVCS